MESSTCLTYSVSANSEPASRLILVKHALPIVDPPRPAREWPLSPEGEEACGRLAEALRPFAPSSVWASEEPKAAETARLLAENLGLTCTIVSGLHEHDRSDLGFMPWSDVEAGVRNLFLRPAERVFGSETGDQALGRFAGALDVVLGQDSETPVVVAHGTVISLYVSAVCGEEGYPIWQRLGTPSFVVVARGRLETIVDSI
jgi:broad specificity phosphatase PhoE